MFCVRSSGFTASAWSMAFKKRSLYLPATADDSGVMLSFIRRPTAGGGVLPKMA